jgi:hypothetical protein
VTSRYPPPVDEAPRSRTFKLAAGGAIMVVVAIIGIVQRVSPILIIALEAIVVVVLVRMWPGTVAGHRPRMWALRDGSYMTGCGCGWAGGPRATQEEAERDIEEHRTDPTAGPGRQP